ncbi:MAG: radical SAM protein [Calditrichaeota bacterium]|nr:MAG: radical SAM protein [Calditrichota bacterium]
MREIIWHKILQKTTFSRLINLSQVATGLILSTTKREAISFGIPPVLQIEPTNSCNLKCPLCDSGNGAMKRKKGNFDLHLFKKILDEIGKKVWLILFYHQGEPFISPDFLAAVRAANKLGIYTNTNTNGHYMSAKVAAETVHSGLDSLILSYDGINQESYAKYRQNGNLEKVRQSVKNLVEAKKRFNSKTPYILLQCLIHKYNEHTRDIIRKQGQDMEVDRVLFKNIQVNSFEDAVEWLPKNENFKRYKIAENRLENKKSGTFFCPRPWTTSLINWDGRVVPCCFDKNATHVMGDLNQENFTKLWRNDKYTRFRKEFLTAEQMAPMCKNCHQGKGIWINDKN